MTFAHFLLHSFFLTDLSDGVLKTYERNQCFISHTYKYLLVPHLSFEFLHFLQKIMVLQDILTQMFRPHRCIYPKTILTEF